MTTPPAARRGQRRRDDRGYVLPAMIITLTLLAIASALTARVFAELLAASATERLAIAHTAAARTARTAADAWMADPAASALVSGSDPRYVSAAGRDVWFTDAAGAGCVPTAHTACWQITGVTVTDTADLLRGGEAVQQRAAVGLRTVAGCAAGDTAACRIDTTAERVYERAVFAYYQIHYDDHDTIPAAFEALYGPSGKPDPAACAVPEEQRPADTVCDDDPTFAHRIGLRDRPVVFTTGDQLNGPLRHSGTTRVWYCGRPYFERIETHSTAAPAKHPSCNSTDVPRWVDDNDSHTLWGLTDPNRNLPPEPPRWVPLPDRLTLPVANVPAGGCSLTAIDYDHTTDPVGAGCDGGIITAAGDITIHRLRVDESVAIAAGGDIIVCGNIKADPPNPAGGPNVVALITLGHVVIAPGIANGQCEDTAAPISTGQVTKTQSVTLDNVAILAPVGGVYTRRWYLPCSSEGCPTLTINGSIAAEHLGLYGIPDPDAGGADHGWTKNFTYPSEFWLARPPLWPNLPPGEWTHHR